MSIQRLILRALLRLRVKRRFQKNPDVMVLRDIMAELAKISPHPPQDIALDHIELAGIKADRLSPPGAPQNKAILHIHGGGWVGGAPRNYWSMIWRLARSAGITAYLPDYRLAPEHPFPAGLDDAERFFDGLIASGIPAQNIVVSGDSAGGNLALALMHRLKARGADMPGGLIAISPATDLVNRDGSIITNAKRDDLFVLPMLESTNNYYCPGRDASDPFISPLMGDLTGFPPTLIHVDATEMLLDASTRLADKMRASKVAVEIDIEPKLWHVWHANADFLPEARASIEKLAQFAVARIGAGT